MDNTNEHLHLLKCIYLLKQYPSLLDHIKQYCNDNPLAIMERDADGWTAIHFVSFYSNISDYLQVLTILVNSLVVKKLMNVETENNILDIKTSVGGFTPLHLLMFNIRNADNVNTLKLLIENGANVNVQTKCTHSTALHILIETVCNYNLCPSSHEYKKIAILMLIRAGTHLRSPDKNGYSVLHLLAMRSNVPIINEILKFLIDCGINFFDTDQKSIVFHLSNELQEYLGDKLKLDAMDTDDIEKKDLACKL